MHLKSRTLNRISKTFSVQAAGLVTNLLTVLALPAAFIGSYGLTKYGEWLAISAGLSWLQTLDFGLQTFIVNELSLEYHRGNLHRVRELQSVALRLSFGLIVAGFLAAVIILTVAPLQAILHLRMTHLEASAIAVALLLQVLLGILWSQLNGMLRSFGHSPRAEAWSQIQRFVFFLITWSAIVAKASLWVVAALPLLSYVALAIVSLVDLKHVVPEAFPTVSYWDGSIAKAILRPSLWFGTFTLSQFLIFQAPILILNQVSGKSAVVVFSLARALFGVVRGFAQVIRQSVSPEITRLSGAGRIPELARLFRLFEQVSLAYCFVGSIAVLVAAPWIVPRWTHVDGLFTVPLFAAMTMNTVVIVAKDTRLALNQFTNRHVRSAILCLISYSLFVLAAIPLAAYGGPTAVVLAWTFVELVQLWLLHIENRTVVESVSVRPLVALLVSALVWIWPAILLGQILKSANVSSAGLALSALGILLIQAFLVFGSDWIPSVRVFLAKTLQPRGPSAVDLQP